MAKPSMEMPGFENIEGVELVQQLALFKPLSFEETRRLCSIARLEKRKAGDVIIEEHALGEGLFIVKSGSATVTMGKVTLGKVGPGELMGEMSLIDDEMTSARVVADGDMELIMIPRGPFDKMMTEDLPLANKVYRAFCRTLSQRLKRANQQVPADKTSLQHSVR